MPVKAGGLKQMGCISISVYSEWMLVGIGAAVQAALIIQAALLLVPVLSWCSSRLWICRPRWTGRRHECLVPDGAAFCAGTDSPTRLADSLFSCDFPAQEKARLFGGLLVQLPVASRPTRDCWHQTEMASFFRSGKKCVAIGRNYMNHVKGTSCSAPVQLLLDFEAQTSTGSLPVSALHYRVS